MDNHHNFTSGSAINSNISALAGHFEQTIADVVASVAAASSQLRSTAGEMSLLAEQSTEQAEEVARSMNQATAGATAAAAASDEFAMSIIEISKQAATSAEKARLAAQIAADADETISALDSAVEEIGQIVSLIANIADRTNLLALNASIEAARSGEHGRGFAVVASEVKDLARQTSAATDEISGKIGNLQSITQNGTGALRQMTSEVREIEASSTIIAAAVDQQSMAGNDLARSIDLAARNTESVRSHVMSFRDNSLTAGSAATQVLSSAEELEAQSGVLREQVIAFLDSVRHTPANFEAD